MIKTFCIFMFAIFFAVTSCKKDDEPVTSATRADYIGSWSCQEYKDGQVVSTYDVQIIEHQTVAAKVLIDNFHMLGLGGTRCEASVDNINLTIPQQIITPAAGGTFSVTGSGYITNKKFTIELQYSVDNVSFTATYTKI